VSGTRPDVPLLLQVFASFAMTGLIWFVQVVHYPLVATNWIRTAAWTFRSLLLLVVLRAAHR
jgi:hypothetical protein